MGAAVARGDNSLEQRVEPCVAGAADWQPAAVGEYRDAILALVLIDARQPARLSSRLMHDHRPYVRSALIEWPLRGVLIDPSRGDDVGGPGIRVE